MDENLVGYLLNSLDSEAHRRVEEYLHGNASAQKRLEQLRRALEPLAADAEPPAPPAGLWIRTLARVAEDRCRRLPAAPRPATVPAGSSRAWWRRADLLVAASVLVLLGGIAIAWIHEVRQREQIEGCKNNLREYHQALVGYSDLHEGEFPAVTEKGSHSVAGIFIPVLNSNGLLPRARNLSCPGNDPPVAPARTLEELERLHRESPEDFRKAAQDLSGCYAYTLGYEQSDGNGQRRHFGLNRNSGDLTPIMADRPPFAVGELQGRPGNSKNHGGRGQNVLHVGGNVTFLKDRTIGEDDIYLNHKKRVGAGTGPGDTVLGASWASPYPVAE